MVAAPLGMVALYFYALGRVTMYKSEAFIIWLLGSLPGVGLFFALKFLSDTLFPDTPKKSQRQLEDEDEFEDEDEDDDDKA